MDEMAFIYIFQWQFKMNIQYLPDLRWYMMLCVLPVWMYVKLFFFSNRIGQSFLISFNVLAYLVDKLF